MYRAGGGNIHNNTSHQEKPMYGLAEAVCITQYIRRSQCMGLAKVKYPQQTGEASVWDCVYTNHLRRSFQYKWHTKRSYMFYNHSNHVSFTGSNHPIAA